MTWTQQGCDRAVSSAKHKSRDFKCDLIDQDNNEESTVVRQGFTTLLQGRKKKKNLELPILVELDAKNPPSELPNKAANKAANSVSRPGRWW